MPKGGGRHAISQSKEDFGPENLHVHYCLCGEFILVVDAPLAQLPRRPFDGSYCLVNRSGPAYRTYKLNVSEHGKDLPPPRPLDKAEGDSLVVNAFGAAGKEGNGVLVNHDGGFEFQRASHLAHRCGRSLPATPRVWNARLSRLSRCVTSRLFRRSS